MHAASRLGVALAIGVGARSACATWSIILVDTRTGEIAVGSATCLTSFDLRAGTPVLIPGVGAAAAQSAVDSTGQNRVFIRDRLALGVAPQDIVTQLATFDASHQSRQYGIVDALGRGATFTGTGDGAYAGGVTGQFTSNFGGNTSVIAYAIQGNVLTGAPVISLALDAITGTDGDLAARLMAGMQAARSMGGDGRCSCSPSLPTSCGSPPPSFSKSAHIGYMLIARIDDREGSNGIYRTGAGSVDIATADLSGNGRRGLVVSNQSSNSISILGNLTPTSGLPFPIFASPPVNIVVGGSPRGVAIAEINGDTHPDALVANPSAGDVRVFRGNAGGFDPPVAVPVGLSPRAIAVAEVNGQPGPDMAVACFDSNAVAILAGDGAGGFGAPVLVPTDLGPVDVVAANLVGSGAMDLAVACRTASRLAVFAGDGAGHFAPFASLTTATPPLAVVAADFDGNGETDLAVLCDAAQVVQVFLNQGGVFTPTSYGIGFTPVDVAAGDVSGDGRPDLVVTGASSYAVLTNNGAGGFPIRRTYTVSSTLAGITLADLDGDGDLDLAMANPGNGAAMTVKNLGPGPLAGTFNDGIGCATGDYFMNFNVAFQQTTSPDPVVQLQGLYDQWRAGLIGRPDAVRSQASLNPVYLPANGVATSTLTIALRDWQGNPITATVSPPTVKRAPNFPGLCVIGPVVSQGGGVYTATITAGATPGVTRFRITVNDGIRPVTLMPDVPLHLVTGCYANCDGSTAAPILTANDFTCFLQQFSAGDPFANCDGSTSVPVLNVNDFQCFLNRFAAGCP